MEDHTDLNKRIEQIAQENGLKLRKNPVSAALESMGEQNARSWCERPSNGRSEICRFRDHLSSADGDDIQQKLIRLPNRQGEIVPDQRRKHSPGMSSTPPIPPRFWHTGCFADRRGSLVLRTAS